MQGNGCWTMKTDSSNNLYVGGEFTSAGGVSQTAYMAKWNSTTNTWSSIGNFNGKVLSIDIDNSNNLYVCGNFTTPVSYIGKYNGITWTALNLPNTGGNKIYAVHYNNTNNTLYCGGDIGMSSTLGTLCKYVNGVWYSYSSNLPSGGVVFQIKSTSTNLYIGGEFTSTGGVSNTAYFSCINL